jgi:hypothetical protein
MELRSLGVLERPIESGDDGFLWSNAVRHTVSRQVWQ